MNSYVGLYGNKGFVQLLDVIPSSIPKGFSSRDAVLANQAKISTQTEAFKNDIEVYSLIEKLFKWGHFSPFEQATLQFKIKAPYVVWSQVDRHRSFLYASQLRRSGRYAEFTAEDFYIPEYFSEENKELLKDQIFTAFNCYDNLFRTGELPKESARFFLPAFCLMYEDLVTVDLKNLMHFLSLRMAMSAQVEIRVLAEAMFDLTRTVFPYTMKIFKENNRPVNYVFEEV